ncbi:2522_t:CDS:2 [Cetraspora pellucida]|uniref:2522_t:CDS:1 n=1 Tax=Cetraspora pellucida TaxID=1433469 RepID=A0ACA9KGJ2_9GLOM|nr:2522_t:CDS:2 [Cetraspora pellucida]
MIKGHLLTEMFSDHLQKKLMTLSTLTDITISLDGWTDNSGNSIYGFMALKESQEIVLDILDLSIHRHTGDFLKNKLKEILVINGIKMPFIIACVTDNPLNMSRLRRLLHYSLAKVCMGVSVYEQGFQHCLSLSETARPKYPEIENETVKNIICDRYHFANNDALTKVIKPIVDAIGRLESSDSTLADIFKELIYIHRQISQLDVPIIGFKAHALAIIGKRAKEFDSNIFFIALFLCPPYKRLAISKKINSEQIIRASLELAKAWNFTKRETGLLHKELIDYNNNDPPFDTPLPDSQSLRSSWSKFSGNAPLLCRFAMKVLAVVPHGASCERLFSSLGLVKSKIRNRLTPDSLSILGQLRNELKKAAPTKTNNRNKPNVEPPALNDESIDIFFDENESMEELNEELEEIVTDMDEMSVMEEFFDFEGFERYQETLGSDQSDLQVEGEWSIDDILNQNRI